MKPKRKHAPRKPRDLKWFDDQILASFYDGDVNVASWLIVKKDCRKLAAWLLKAADWLEWKEKQK